jgi:type IV fimbrial biogenesis protein FimT
MSTRRQHGFTLWELLMTLLVAGVLLGIGVPNVMEFQRNSRMTGAANDLITAVLVARTEAVKRRTFVAWCLSNDPMAATPTCATSSVADSDTHGFVTWIDENDNFDANDARILTDGTDGNAAIDAGELVLMRTPAPGLPIRVSSNCGYASFAPTGALRQAGTLCAPNLRAVVFCDDRGRRVASGGLSSARVVRIDRPGRAQVLTEKTQVDAILNVLGVGTCP